MSGAPADLSKYATHFNELEVESHQTIFDINAVNPLSKLRDDFQNVVDNESEYQLTTAANTDDAAILESEERGQYSAGFMATAGVGVRVPTTPTGDSTMRWGYYDNDGGSFDDPPDNGFYFGADSNGNFVARANNGTIEKVYQENWNRDKVDNDEALNPSGRHLDLTDGHVFRIDFTYYGYGPIEMQIMFNDDDADQFGVADLVTVHAFTVDDSTTIKETNLPARAEVNSGGTANDALDLFVGGRQFSVIGERSSNERTCWHYRDSLAVDDTQWHPAMSFKLKDGTDIGAIDFSHILGEVLRFYADTDANAYKWQVRIDTVPVTPSWETPESHADDVDASETAFKVDTTSTDITDGSGNLTGVNIDGGMLAAGQQNQPEVSSEEIDGTVAGDQVVTLLFKATPTASGTVSEILWKMGERW